MLWKVPLPRLWELDKDTLAHVGLKVGEQEIDLSWIGSAPCAVGEEDLEGQEGCVWVPGIHRLCRVVQIAAEDDSCLELVDKTILGDFAAEDSVKGNDRVRWERIFKRTRSALNDDT